LKFIASFLRCPENVSYFGNRFGYAAVLLIMVGKILTTSSDPVENTCRAGPVTREGNCIKLTGIA
jgi:hypothetical protein